MTFSERSVSSWSGCQAVRDDGSAGFATIGLYWCIPDPFAVKATIRHGGTVAVWAWSRDLLTHGLATEVGDGDVRIWPSGDVVIIRLVHGFSCQLVVSATFLGEFLARTYTLCPPGAEYADVGPEAVEAELRDLLEMGEAA